MICRKCVQPVDCKTDLFVVCEGKCYVSFHAACVGLSEASVCCLNRNVIWLCDDCLAAFHDHQRQQQASSDEPMQTVPHSITAEFIDITTKLTKLMKRISPSQTADQLVNHTIEASPQHSTPIRFPKLLEGSKNETRYCPKEIVESDSSSNVSCCSEGSFSLFLTNIDGRVTEEEIGGLVSESLGLDQDCSIDVKKLVPKWKPDDVLDYASFKVMLNNKYKKTALQTHTWPPGIMYREFFNRTRKTWKPT